MISDHDRPLAADRPVLSHKCERRHLATVSRSMRQMRSYIQMRSHAHPHPIHLITQGLESVGRHAQASPHGVGGRRVYAPIRPPGAEPKVLRQVSSLAPSPPSSVTELHATRLLCRR